MHLAELDERWLFLCQDTMVLPSKTKSTQEALMVGLVHPILPHGRPLSPGCAKKTLHDLSRSSRHNVALGGNFVLDQAS
eukprot:6928043-Lingulodinium_polyedra.AAC.1